MGWNLKQIKKAVGVPIMAVIKANAYGHGISLVGPYLDQLGIDSLMVGKFQEAVQLRNTGVSCPIHNFGPISETDPKWLVEHSVSQSVFSEKIYALDSMALQIGKKALVHIHIDTGMARMGIPYSDAPAYINKVARLSGVKIMGISTTLTEDEKYDKIQLDRFNAICQGLQKEGISLGFKHAASSGGIFTLPSAYLDMVRPGITLYGYYPSDSTQAEDSLSLRPVLQLKTRVEAVKALRSGDSVSYHQVYKAKKKEKIAILPIGYSDGYPPTAVNKGSVLIQGELHPIIASITANHMEVLLSKDSPVSVGDEAVLIGTQGDISISAFDVARCANISIYKLLISLNPLLFRIKINPIGT
ncbi:MAG: alanine racemase [Candidatus Aminicenantes bacterium]|nr:alanine racemase [Candidatus Aminicenantes bacterium]